MTRKYSTAAIWRHTKKDYYYRVLNLHKALNKIIVKRDLILERLLKYRTLIDNHSNYTFNDLLNNSNLYKTVVVKHYSRVTFPIENGDIKIMFETYFELQKEIDKLNSSIYNYMELYTNIKKKDNGNINVLYNFCIAEFNAIMTEMIIKGYQFDFGHGLSLLRISRRERKEVTVNWGASIKERDKLLSEGKIPKSKETPDGVHWLFYHISDYTNFWQWVKKYASAKNNIVYTFKPTSTHKDGNVTLLHNYISNNPEIVHKYHLIKKDKNF